eukprot:COSAG01_NODE_29584_length_634_cov_1.142056_2_plen_32_part_01
MGCPTLRSRASLMLAFRVLELYTLAEQCCDVF